MHRSHISSESLEISFAEFIINAQLLLLVRRLRWSSDTLVPEFKPGRSRWIFRASENSSACLPSEGKWKNLCHVPALRHVKEPSTSLNYECASKIPCIVPSFADRGLSCLCGAWRLWWWMRGTHWGVRVQSAYRLQWRKAPHVTFNFF